MSDRVLRKRQKLVATETNKLDVAGLVAGPSNRQSSPSPPSTSIFKLTADCCNEIFEYLSLEDLHSFGQTCKTFNKVTGEYFKQNYSTEIFDIHSPGALQIKEGHTTISRIVLVSFNRYVTKAHCTTHNSRKYLAQHADEFTSIKSLHCSEITLKHPKINHKILPKIEQLKFTDLNTEKNIRISVDELMGMCSNLKSLDVELCLDVSYDNNWLHQIYPNLTQFKFDPLPPIADLIIFLEQNPSVSSFSANFEDIWKNKDSFLSSTIKMDLLKVDNFNQQPPESIDLLNQLYERGFYKRLHLMMWGIDQQLNDILLTLQGLEKIMVSAIRINYCLPQLPQLKRLDIGSFLYPEPNELEILANGLVKLERFSVIIRSFDDILPFIRRSIFLRKIQVLIGGEEKVLKLTMLNKEREKLVGARKVTIYVEDDVYLATKWATENGDTNLSLVEMRRISSFEWDEFKRFLQ